MKKRFISILCVISMLLPIYTVPAFAQEITQWEFDSDSEGWAVNKAGKGVSIGNEEECLVYTVDAAGTTNTFLLSPDNLGIKGSDYQKITLKVKNELGTVSNVKVAFVTDADSSWDSTWTGSLTKTVFGPSLSKSDDFVDCVIDMSSNKNWMDGTIKRIRILISEFSGAQEGTMYIDNIMLGDVTASTDEETDVAAGNETVFNGVTEKEYREAAGILRGAGLIDKAGLDTDHIMTRGEFAYLISHSLFSGIPQAQTNNTAYSDVPGVYKYADAIRIVSDAGVMSGTGDGKFYPHRELTADECVAALIKLTGYGLWAEHEGGYPSGYYRVAQYNKILDDITLDKTINYAQAVVMLKSALDADYVEYINNGKTEGYRQVQGTSVLSKVADVYEGKGIMVSNPVTSTTSAGGTGSDTILIDIGDRLLKLKDVNNISADCLGTEVEFAYCIENDESRLIYINSTEDNEILTVNYSEIDSATTTRKLIFEQNHMVKIEEIPTSIATIYNGRYYTKETNDTYKPTYGSVRLVDNNSDGVFDVIFVENLTLAEVSSVDEETVYYNDGGIKKDYRNYDYIRVIRNGKASELSSLREGDMVLIGESDDKENVIINASNKTLTATVTSYMPEEYAIYSGDEKYRINPHFAESIKTGAKYKFKLDAMGNIAGLDDDYVTDNSYAFIISLESEQSNETPVWMKLYTHNDGVKKYQCSQKIRIDGVTYNTQDTRDKGKISYHLKEATTKLNIGMGDHVQPIKIKMDADGLIKDIDTILIKKQDGSLIKDTEGDALNSLIMGDNAQSLHYYDHGVFAGEFAINSKTVMFNIPEEVRDYNGYLTVKMSDLKEDAYTVMAFNSTDYGYSDFVLLLNKGTVSYEENIAVVSNILDIYDNTFEEGKGVTVIADGKEFTLKIYNGQLPADLENGDVIRYSLRYDGNCNKITRLLKYSTDKTAYTNKLTTTTGSGSYTSQHRFVYGKVTNKKNSFFTVSYGGVDDEEVFVAGDCTVAIYDSENDVTEKGSFSDIVGKDQDGNGSDIAMYTRYGIVKNIVVFK